MIVAQAFINISVVLGLLPTKGIPLPLLSNGGSSLLVSLLGIGILPEHYRSMQSADARGEASVQPLLLMIAGGGTGGHLYPGIAVARELLARMPDAKVTFVGTAAGIEARVIPREGFPLELIRSAGLKGKSIGALARGMALLPLGALDAARHRTDPAVGGAWRRRLQLRSVVMLAAIRGIPTLLMEQNADSRRRPIGRWRGSSGRRL